MSSTKKAERKSLAAKLGKGMISALDGLINVSEHVLERMTPASLGSVQEDADICVECEREEQLMIQAPRITRSQATGSRGQRALTRNEKTSHTTGGISPVGANLSPAVGERTLKDVTLIGPDFGMKNGSVAELDIARPSYGVVTSMYCFMVILPFNIAVSSIKTMRRLMYRLYKGPRDNTLKEMKWSGSPDDIATHNRRVASPKKRLSSKSSSSIFTKLVDWVGLSGTKRPVSRLSIADQEEINKSPNKADNEAHKRKREQMEAEEQGVGTDSEEENVNYGNFNFEDYNSEDDDSFNPGSEASEDSLEYRSNSELDDSFEEPLCTQHRRIGGAHDVTSHYAFADHKVADRVIVSSIDEGNLKATSKDELNKPNEIGYNGVLITNDVLTKDPTLGLASQLITKDFDVDTTKSMDDVDDEQSSGNQSRKSSDGGQSDRID